MVARTLGNTTVHKDRIEIRIKDYDQLPNGYRHTISIDNIFV